MKPTLGRIVHFLVHQPDGSKTASAAIVTYVYPDDDANSVDLTVFRRNSAAAPLMQIKEDGKNDLEASPYSWMWPPRE